MKRLCDFNEDCFVSGMLSPHSPQDMFQSISVL